MKITVLKENKGSQILEDLCEKLEKHSNLKIVNHLSPEVLKQTDLFLIAADVNPLGENTFISNNLLKAFEQFASAFVGLQAGFLIVSDSIFFSKNYARRLAFLLNQRGVFFHGQSLFEVVGEYENFATWQKSYSLSLKEVCYLRFDEFYSQLVQHQQHQRRHLLALHASERVKSNTYALWRLVMKNLSPNFNITELHIENGEIIDCKGCAYDTCLHFASQKSCFYGGQVTTEILPAIEMADIIIWICPNYNDAVSAMHTALINRLTVLYRRIDFSLKQFYGIVISANSGSDLLAEQLIGALNFNKGMMLPANAFLFASANDPGSVLNIPDIKKRASDFAKIINRQSSM